jgi:hypothetical protein
MQNLELYAGGSNGNVISGTVTGARYQIGSLAVGADIALPMPGVDFGIAPNVQFSMDLTEAVALGLGADFGIQLLDDTRTRLNTGAEIDLKINEPSMFWLGCDVFIPISEDNRDVEISPTFGVAFSKNDISLRTYLVFQTEGDDIIRRHGIDVTVGF